MNIEEQNYLNLLKYVLKDGFLRKDRTGVGTLSVFGANLKFSLKDKKIPLLTTKKMFMKGIIEELLFFIRGESDTKKLEKKGVNIWKGNTSREFLDNRNLKHLKEGDMGKMYGKQWRDWGGANNIKGIDQISNTIDLIKKDPHSRRIIVSALNVRELDEMVLHPCHPFFQFYVEEDNLSCIFYMRSVDLFLGFPFNIVSYSILTHMIADLTNKKAKEVVFFGGDCHIYSNHFEQVKEQCKRIPFDFPTINIKKEINNINDIENLNFDDFELLNYKSHKKIKAQMSI